MENNKKSRIIILFLMIFIVILIVSDFFFADPKYTITSEIIVCISLLIVLALSEIFDNLSIPRVISLSKNLKESKKENGILKEANMKLLQQITNINNSVSATNNFIITGSSNIEDINKNTSFSLNEQDKTDVIEFNKNYKKSPMGGYNYKNDLELFMLRKVLKLDNGESEYDGDIQYGVNLESISINEDGVKKNLVRFDAIKSNDLEDIFYEVKIPNSIDYSHQLQNLLHIVALYKESNKKACKLVLILPILDEKLEKIVNNSFEYKISMIKDQISDIFDYYISNDLLEIKEINVSKKELDEYINSKTSKNIKINDSSKKELYQ